MTSLGTQIMFPRKFVEFLEQTKMLLELLYHKHEMYKNVGYTSVTVDILLKY